MLRSDTDVGRRPGPQTTQMEDRRDRPDRDRPRPGHPTDDHVPQRLRR